VRPTRGGAKYVTSIQGILTINQPRELEDVYWKLVELDGKPVDATACPQEPHLLFLSEGSRLAGSGGCNRLAGTYEATGDELRFQPIAMTRMACEQSVMELEHAVAAALRATESYHIEDNELALCEGERVRARLRAAP
jgi:heat shock protein HslJ